MRFWRTRRRLRVTRFLVLRGLSGLLVRALPIRVALFLESEAFISLATKRRNFVFDGAALAGLRVERQVARIRVDRSIRVANALGSACEVVENDRLRIECVRLGHVS